MEKGGTLHGESHLSPDLERSVGLLGFPRPMLPLRGVWLPPEMDTPYSVTIWEAGLGATMAAVHSRPVLISMLPLVLH